jgi:hypothetical protein
VTKSCGYRKSDLLALSKDCWLKLRVPKAYIDIAREIGGGNVSRGFRKALIAEAERLGLISGTKKEAMLMLYAAAFSGTEVLAAVERAPLSLKEITGQTGMTEEEVEECVQLLMRRGLLAEEKGRYTPTVEGRYMLSMLDTIDRDLEVLRGNGGLEAVTTLHIRIAERLVTKKGDIKDAVDSIIKTANLMKQNTEALFRIIT